MSNHPMRMENTNEDFNKSVSVKVVSSDDLTNMNIASFTNNTNPNTNTTAHQTEDETPIEDNMKDEKMMEASSSSSESKHGIESTCNDNKWTKDARIYEYGSAANPDMKPIPVLVHPSTLHELGKTRVIPFDISQQLDIPGRVEEEDDTSDHEHVACTSPNLLASFIRINVGDGISTQVPNATSQAFYVIRGSGTTKIQADDEKENGEDEEENIISWSTGDMFCIPATSHEMIHICTQAESHGGAAIYWIHDEPLLRYLGVRPNIQKFEPTLYKRSQLLQHIQEIQHETGKCHKTASKNRLGVLLGNAKCDQTKTMTHVLWSLLNSIPADTVQRPHRHNSVALDLCVSAEPNKVYTLMGKEIDSEGFIVNPIRCDWVPGSVFITPPGWWHSHHNESSSVAWVLPVQDAGLYTYQRTLDIRFVDDELKLHKSGRIRGSAFDITNKAYTEMVQIGARVPDPQKIHVEGGVTKSSDEKEAVSAAGMKRVFSAECLLSSKRLRCTQIGADPDLVRKLNNRFTSLEGHVESIFD